MFLRLVFNKANIDHKAYRTKYNANIRKIEYSKIEEPDFDIIDNIAKSYAVDKISDSSCDNCHRTVNHKRILFLVLYHPYGEQNYQCKRENYQKPTCSLKAAERRSPVFDISKSDHIEVTKFDKIATWSISSIFRTFRRQPLQHHKKDCQP